MKYIDADKLRSEIEGRMDEHWEGLPNADSPENDWTHNELCELGAYKELEHLETFLDTLSEEPDKNLDEAAEEYRRESYTKSVMPNIDGPMIEYGGSIKDAFKAGARWQAEQGQSKEGKVFDNNEFIKFSDGSYIDLCPDLNHMAFKVKDGDKVIVQIRKEDERG